MIAGKFKTRRFFLVASVFLTILVCSITSLPDVSAEGKWNIANVYHTPVEPYAGQIVTLFGEVENYSQIDSVQAQYCTVYSENLTVKTCFFEYMEDLGNKTYSANITQIFDGGTTMGYKVIVIYDNGTREYDRGPGEFDYYYFNYTGTLHIVEPSEIPIEVIVAEVVLGIVIITFAGLLIYRKRKNIKTEKNKILVGGIVGLLMVALLYGIIGVVGSLGTIEKASDFSIKDIDGNYWNLTDHSNEVVVIEFMGFSCPPCETMRQNLEGAVGDFEENEIEVVSIFVGGLSDSALRDYRDDKQVEWTVISDPGDLQVEYEVSGIPKLFVINKEGFITYRTKDEFVPDSEEMKAQIIAALEGTAQPISLHKIGIFATAVVMGFATYFSPCSFPMLPGYVSFYLTTEVEEKKKSWRRVTASGLISGFGIVLVFLIIGIISVSLGEAADVGKYIIYLGPIVAVLLIILGALMFTNLQYHALIRPFQKLRAALFGKKDVEADSKRGYYFKLFGYGVGYGAAASACTAPLFIGLLLASSVAGTLVDGLIVILIFSATILILMLAITFLLSVFGQESVQKLSAHTDKIKKVSGLVLIIVGVYLILYYLFTFVL